MADENDNTDDKTFTKAEMEAAVAAAVEGLKRKNSELLDETKAERDKRQALERAQEEADAERQKQAGEFRALYEKTQAELEKERAEKRDYIAKVQRRELEAEAAKFAGTLTRDTSRAEDLAEHFMRHAKHTDDGIKLELGGVEIAREKFAEHIKSVRPYLVDGNQSNGGGANGGSGGAAKKISEMNDEERLALARDNPEAFRKMREAI